MPFAMGPRLRAHPIGHWLSQVGAGVLSRRPPAALNARAKLLSTTAAVLYTENLTAHHNQDMEDPRYASSQMELNPLAAVSLINIHNATPSTKTFTFRVDAILSISKQADARREFKFRPGQWVELSSAALTNTKTRFSISSPPKQDPAYPQTQFSITVKDAFKNPIVKYLHDAKRFVGDGTQFHAQVGGAFFYRNLESCQSAAASSDPADASKVLMIAGGVGIAPLMSMLEYIVGQHVAGVLAGQHPSSSKKLNVTLLYSVLDEREFLFLDRLKELASTFSVEAGNPLVLDIQCFVTRYAIREGRVGCRHSSETVEQPPPTPADSSAVKFFYGSYITPRLLSDYFLNSGVNVDNTTVYMCGPETLERAVYAILEKLEYPMDRLYFERWWK
ncbi:hypothetical protein CcCBS67573_g03175 [Chytriomyces confervae]|uniref:Oxidoreductase NAD-binding domain-containing protein 1 n=1 Tax=Chytriomyces confervae TaxID=246404 RepID=A0A507FH10_9FUNG|nr:hypothetical protein CcCBS67573_g03175 [Chytriomyces confervae]